MSFVSKLPRTSLTLLLFTYSIFGWLFPATLSKPIWMLETTLVLLLPFLLTAPLTLVTICFDRWLSSDTRYFVTGIILAFVGVFVITWIHIFANFLVLLSAGTLARLDIQTAGFTKRQAFLILLAVSLVGLAIGLIIRQLF